MKLIIAALLVSLVAAAFAANLFFGDFAEDDAMRQNRVFSEQVDGYQAGVEAGNATAEYRLGMVYLNAPVALRDVKKAIALFRKAAAQGQVKAIYQLAQAYENGTGLDISYGEAANLYRTAIRIASDPHSMLSLGMLYFHGKGVVQNGREAAEWFGRAAREGEPAAQFLMGRIYETGYGVPKDPIEAYKWYTLAAKDVDAVTAFNPQFDPKGALKTLAAGMNQSQIDAAKRDADQWQGQDKT